MKKYLLFASLIGAAVLFASCNKEQGVSLDGKPVEISVSINGVGATRATGTTYANESKVNNLQVFVFNGGEREAYRDAGAQMSALIPATAGERSVWAVVNAPSLSGLMTESALKAAVSGLSDNALDSFVMTGSTTTTLVDGGNVPVDVRRIVSRVSIAKISADLKDYRSSYSVSIKGIYMINVAGDSKYDVDGTPSLWLNKLGHEDSSYDALLYDRISNVTVSNAQSYEAEHAFYPYPNALPAAGQPDDYADTWNPRGSILVIEAEMLDGNSQPIVLENGSTTGYYPIVLPALERNKTYSIEEVCITRLPGTVPYKPIETGETQVTITVHEWELGLNLGTVTI